MKLPSGSGVMTSLTAASEVKHVGAGRDRDCMALGQDHQVAELGRELRTSVSKWNTLLFGV